MHYAQRAAKMRVNNFLADAVKKFNNFHGFAFFLVYIVKRNDFWRWIALSSAHFCSTIIFRIFTQLFWQLRARSRLYVFHFFRE